MKKLFLTASGAFGAIPGVMIMWKGILTPPGYGALFGGVIQVFGVLGLLLLFLNKVTIQRMRHRRIVRTTIALVLASFIFLFVYIMLFNFCVISHPTNHTVFFPLWTSGELRKFVSSSGGRWAALDEFGWFGIYGAVQKMPAYAIPVTVLVLLICYQGVFTGLTLAFGLLGIHQEKAPDSNRATREEPGGKPISPESAPKLDIFISHASEDKDSIARPLYHELVARGVSVWFDEARLELGDSLRRKIDEGLARSRFGVVILSPAFLEKDWPQLELDGLVARETASGRKAILPVWHNIDAATLAKYSPLLAGRLAARSSDGIPAVAEKILRVLNMSSSQFATGLK